MALVILVAAVTAAVVSVIAVLVVRWRVRRLFETKLVPALDRDLGKLLEKARVAAREEIAKAAPR